VIGGGSRGRVTGISATRPPALRADLVLLPHRDAQVEAAGLSTNAYAVLGPHGAVLVDAVFADTVPDAETIATWGVPPVALVLTHRHLVPQADGLDAIARRLDVPLFLHPLDAAHPQAGRGRAYHDPTRSTILADAGIEVVPFPGHTAGHVALYLAAQGGALLAGDAATSVSDPDAPPDGRTLVRPPVAFNVDDGQLRAVWLAFARPLATVAPLHGAPLVQRADAVATARADLTRPEPTTEFGVGDRAGTRARAHTGGDVG
jgi:glyoxylase-like metal-dependent hydrolase (beta-lactamase superfamily II)